LEARVVSATLSPESGPLSVVVLSTAPHFTASIQEIFSCDGDVVLGMGDAEQPATLGSIVDLIVIDCTSWSGDVFGAVASFRRQWTSAAIVCVGVRDERAAAALLKSGADTALTPRVSRTYRDELLRAAARRMRLANAQLRVSFGDLVYDRESSRVWCAGHEVQLTRRELKVFDCLFMHAGASVSVTTLQDYVWHGEPASGSNPVAVYMRCLRRKLAASRLAAVLTVRGRGYRLTSKSPRARATASSDVESVVGAGC
jgi:DNA-binding response OmpR family regulator